MPSINRIRVNNVKYNFGTQFYDDFTMRLYGKNTLYDLANGGGKSVLMLLLLQNMIPNCTLDDKQPIEKLFRTGNGNTTIHSLVEWKLDDTDREDGYRYMTTGFCARKAKESDSETENRANKDVASIEYFNYCIFYKEYNKHDIVNLPLVKEGERVTFSGLKNFLKELEHRDMSLKVRIFERKGEYQRFISEYGIHESQWEIIRGINKTEGHVRTYFENNYKTTRKVVEDLLIEEIIEKAFLVKTSRDEDGTDSMAKMLMDIKEQLTVLAKKKKDIKAYDRQAELIGVLADKVESFIGLYKEQSNLSELLANICVTGEEFARNDEKHLKELELKKDEARELKNKQRERIECLKVSKDKRQLEELMGEEKLLMSQVDELNERAKTLKEDLNLKESVNEYMEYLEDRAKYYQHDAVIKTMMTESSFDEEKLYTYAYNIKMRMDKLLMDYRSQIESLTKELSELKEKEAMNEKLLSEARVSLAVAKNVKAAADEEIVNLSEELSNIRMSMNSIRFTDVGEQLSEAREVVKNYENSMEEAKATIDENTGKIQAATLELNQLKDKFEENNKFISDLEAHQSAYEEATAKLDNIKTVYGASKEEELLKIISDRITQAVLDIAAVRKNIEKSMKSINRLKEGRIINISKAAKKAMDYIETRHGITAMFGMDYLSALPVDKQKELLATNPELPYGVLVKDYEAIAGDPNIYKLDTEEEMVSIYDMEAIDSKAVHFGDNAFSIHADVNFLTDEGTKDKLIDAQRALVKDYELQLDIKDEMLSAYRQDQEFVLRMSESELLKSKERLKAAEELGKQLAETKDKLEADIKGYRLTIDKTKEQLASKQEELEKANQDITKLFAVEKLTDIISSKEEIADKARTDIERLEQSLNTLINTTDDENISLVETEAKLKSLNARYDEITKEWDDNYKAYYNIDKEYQILTIGDDELKARFTAMVSMGSNDAKAIEDKKLLMDTIKVSMDRALKNIEKRGVSLQLLKEFENNNLLFVSDDKVLESCKHSIRDVENQITEARSKQDKKRAEINRLEGSIQYAIKNIEDAFGQYVEEQASLSEITATLADGEELLKRLAKDAKDYEDEYRNYLRQQGYMVDLYKDVKRIVTTNDISLEGAIPIMEEKDKLREIFEDSLLKFDRSNKALDKAKNELVRFKGNTSVALEQMSAFELANTIREDVIIPVDYEAASLLMENLKSISEYIVLERDRIEKSLVDMETIKANFEEQCLQRCLDVKTELDKLPKLSRIVADGEAIQMVGLNIPYFKEEFLKQRMSQYIDNVVAQADDYSNEKEQVKFIRNSLALKKLFGVIVTDMNGIKLSLYKRERIKEQSRYLKYEEAVGSTGQSQGIYIQFLVSIINYISGMYHTGHEDVRTKTIFIDNPFGAAKDVYIWEPIFALLKANNVQLIVPARGATPAITGRFDVNYILGQQMSKGKQLTVVTDYTSKVDQEELEYKDLEFEQVSFDFI
ncbi:MAG: hypothetical protein IJO70_11125 [Lachnospiraceae bacterium]|nr:hypothetical protein [Lachnospiraceae bacterium]